MRRQEPIYIQNSNSGVRNRDMLNVNMSSDICIFEAPLFNLSGASKLDCTGNTGTTYVITTATTIPITFQFTGNTDTFTGNSATFKYEIYKYNNDAGIFYIPPVYTSSVLQYSGFSGTNETSQDIPISALTLDGEYLVKGYYEFDVCTDFMNRLGKTIDTLVYRTGSEYGLYEPNIDYFFRAIREADTPLFSNDQTNQTPYYTLFQQVISPTVGSTSVVISESIDSFFVLTLNGLALAPLLDYTTSGNVVTLSAATAEDDIITVIYTVGTGDKLVGTTIDVTSSVPTGPTDGQGSNQYYYNTTTSKYEIYTDTIPRADNNILVMINGATLANGVDYYQSITNSKRIILEGNILVGDVILIVYIPSTNVINGLTTNISTVSWYIENEPKLVNGVFSLEVSTANTFTTLYSSTDTDYVVDKINYSDQFTASGAIGTTLYYRVKNEKNFVTICGDIVSSVNYSETIPVVIQTNSINSY